mmetsp:Transcript_29789/g.80592  ORF Transcript_29789/g.80592 Transcript_29789/m.80592 type:complete len:480 (+) Transcript_29789:1083-2522(+)
MEAEDGAEGAVRRPPQQVPGGPKVVASAVGVDKGLEVVHAGVDHRLHARLQGHAVTCPPDRVAVVRRALLVIQSVHPSLPVRLGKLRERQGAAVKEVARGFADSLIIADSGGVVHVGAPGRVVKPIPLAICLRCVDKGRRDREAPVVVEPPEREAASHPLAQAMPAEGSLLRGGLQATSVPGGDGVGVVVEVGPQAVARQILEPLGEVWEERRVRVLVVPVRVVVRAPPVHVQRPDVDRQLILLPALDVAFGLSLRVGVPPREPGAVGVVRQQGNRASQLQELPARGFPLQVALPEEEDIGVTFHVVTEVVAMRRPKLGLHMLTRGDRRRAPGRRVEAREIDKHVALRITRRWPMEQVLRLVIIILCVVDHAALLILDEKAWGAISAVAHFGARSGLWRPQCATSTAEEHRVAGRLECDEALVRVDHLHGNSREGPVSNHEGRPVLEAARPLRLDAHKRWRQRLHTDVTNHDLTYLPKG